MSSSCDSLKSVVTCGCVSAEPSAAALPPGWDYRSDFIDADEEAALLHVSADQPALLFQRVTRDPSGAPVEYVRSLYRGDRYEVHTRLERLG